MIKRMLLCVLAAASLLCMSCSRNPGENENFQMEPQTDIVYEYSEEEIWCRSGEKDSYGVLFRPKREGKIPLVIYSHGLNANYEAGATYGYYWAPKGIALYCFDFCGGSENSRSSGSALEMSVMTEISDLEAVLEMVSGWDFVDPERIILAGDSQGGIVTALTAARNSERLEGIILQCPAFNIPDLVHEKFQTEEEIPDNCFFVSMVLGRKYFEDVWDCDPYQEISGFTKPVLLLHGEEDDIVDISYSEYAARVYRNADYYRVKDAGHHLIGDQGKEVVTQMDSFLTKLGWEEAE